MDRSGPRTSLLLRGGAGHDPARDGGGPTPAQRLLSGRQRAMLAPFPALGVVVAFVATHDLGSRHPVGLATFVYIVVGGFRAWLVHGAWRRADNRPAAAPGCPTNELPPYTVLVPLYREANVLEPLVAHLSRLDYPQDRLEILLICEADDEETIAAVRLADLPDQFRLVVCPDGVPRTKPRACNYGLAAGHRRAVRDLRRRGPARTRPAPAGRRRLSRCARLMSCASRRRSITTTTTTTCSRGSSRSNTTSGSTFASGLVRSAFPVPLGGTSNHLRVAASCARSGVGIRTTSRRTPTSECGCPRPAAAPACSTR